MSAVTVDAVRQGYEALNRALAEDDLSAYVREFYDPEIVMEMGLLEGTIRGHEGVVRSIGGQADFLEGLRFDPEEITVAGENVVVSLRFGGQGRSTGLPFETHAVHVLTHRDGKVLRVRLYASKAKAMQDLGLLE